MDRRRFLRNSLWAMGALTLPGSGHWAANATASGATNPQTERNRATSYKKSMMWGMVGMPGTVLEKCMALKAAGFDGVELDSHMDHIEVHEALEASGLIASGVCNTKHWRFPLSSDDAEIRKQGMEGMVTAMQDAKVYGTDTVLLVPGRVDKNTSYDQCWERSSACVKELLPVAKSLGVRIAIENVWNNFIFSPIEAKSYLRQFDSPDIGFYFDVGNIVPYGWPEQWINILGDWILRIHIKEYSLELAEAGGKGKGFDAKLLEGSVDWPAVMAAIRGNYNSEWLTIEHHGGDTAKGLSELAGQLDQIIKG